MWTLISTTTTKGFRQLHLHQDPNFSAEKYNSTNTLCVGLDTIRQG